MKWGGGVGAEISEKCSEPRPLLWLGMHPPI